MTKSIYLLLLLSLFIGCRDSEAERKIDGNLKSELLRLKDKGQPDQRIAILFMINEELTDLHHEVLRQKGIEIKTNIGKIYTATIPAKSVYSFAKLRFIDSIQGQSMLKAFPADSSSIQKP